MHQHAVGADVFVHFRPMDSFSPSDQFEVVPLLRARFGQSPGPRQGHADNPTVNQTGGDQLVGNFNIFDPRGAIAIHSAPHDFFAASASTGPIRRGGKETCFLSLACSRAFKSSNIALMS